MDIINNKGFDNFNDGSLTVAIGSFDGLHRGHQEVIKEAKNIAEDNNMKSGVFSFIPHPLKVLKPGEAPKSLINHEQKASILTDIGIDYFLRQKFTTEFSKMGFKEFILDIMINKLNVKHIIVGEDFKFGHEGMGHVNSLSYLGNKYGFEVTVLKAVKLNNEKISSTKIRNFIKEGNIKKATEYLGRYFQIEGKVIEGDGRGRNIGFPTANISVSTDYVLPPNGVYAVYVIYNNKKFKGITNLGFRPTFQGENYSFETHIIDFKGHLYDTQLKIEFVNYIREERKFNNRDELAEQINSDILYTNNLLCYNK